jgi:WD40 repeat protein
VRDQQVWDIKGKRAKCQLTLKEHVDWVKCFQFDAKRVVSGSYDSSIKVRLVCTRVYVRMTIRQVWDMKSGKCQRTLRGHTGGINSLQYDVDCTGMQVEKQYFVIGDGVALISAAADCSLRFW